MTTPAAGTTKRRPPKAPVPTPEPAPQWPAIGGDADTLRAMPHVTYLFAELAPPTSRPIVITRDKDAELREASAAAKLLPEAHEQLLDEWLEGAYERTHGPTRDWCQPRHARPTDAAEGTAGASPVPPAVPPEPDAA